MSTLADGNNGIHATKYKLISIKIVGAMDLVLKQQNLRTMAKVLLCDTSAGLEIFRQNCKYDFKFKTGIISCYYCVSNSMKV